MESIPSAKAQRLSLDSVLFKKAALVLRALNNKLRQQLLTYLDERKEASVTEIYKKFRIEQSVTSQQLGILRQQGFVKTRREGKKIYYAINYDGLALAHRLAAEMVKIKSHPMDKP